MLNSKTGTSWLSVPITPPRISVARRHRRVRRALVGFVLLLAASQSFSQDSPRGDALRDLVHLSGLGIVGAEIAGETDCRPNGSGAREAPLFDAPNGRQTARLEWRIDNYSCGAFLVRDNESAKLDEGWDHPETSDESVGLVYFEVRNGFARVFERTAPSGLWVRITDLPGQSLRPWARILVESPYIYRGYDGFALHEQPSEGSRVLVALRERHVHDSGVHQLTPTGESSGEWGQFDVTEFNGDFYALSRAPDTAPTGNQWRGWLRLVTPDGAPEFWFFTRD